MAASSTWTLSGRCVRVHSASGHRRATAVGSGEGPMPYCAFCGTQVEVGSRPCPACGRLPGGAPTVVVKQKGLSAAVVVAILVAMAFLSVPFIGIIAAIAIPNLLNAIDRSKQKRDMADLRSIG